MKLRRILIYLFVFALSACSQSSSLAKTTNTPTHPAELMTPQVYTTPAPNVREAAKSFLSDWQAEKYDQMYAMLTASSQDATPSDVFIKRYKNVAVMTTLQKLDFEVLSTLTNMTTAQAHYRVTFRTALMGDISRENTIDFTLDQDIWRVNWDDGLIMPELHGGNELALDYLIPSRGNIYDRNGNPIALTTDAVALGVIPGQIKDSQEGTLLTELSNLTGKPAEWIRALYKDASSGSYIAVGETTKDQFGPRKDVMDSLSGVQWGEFTSRYYAAGGLAPHVTGYVQFIPKDQLDEYLRKGYKQDEKVGTAGLEKWGEQYLAGTKGVKLYVTDSKGQVITRLSSSDPQPSNSIYTTIDAKLQEEAQKAIHGFNGSIVVIERDTGRVLAMVSSPGFDPNQFEPSNLNNSALGNMLADQRQPLVNRAAQGGGYPLGSVFKIVTMATALETGVFTPESTYDCQHTFTELPGYTLYDWTFEKKLPPSGMLTLPEGLMRSCNPWFYHIGLELSKAGKADELTKMARAFGLGVPTGIQQVAESDGNIPDANSDEVAVQMSIGQDKILVTPLQVADMIAAVGNGGTLYRPQVVEKITDPDGKEIFSFKSEVRSKLPVSQDTLTLIQETLRKVVADPRGTAVRAFSGLGIPVYGKTGTAQTDDPTSPHAWFAGYTDAQRSDKPDIAIAVIAEYAGEGSEVAAPIFRRIVEVYFLGQPQRVYPWESKINVTRTPTPNAEKTQKPANNDGGPAQPSVPQATETPGFSVQTATPQP